MSSWQNEIFNNYKGKRSNIYSYFLDFFFPRTCLSCNSQIDSFHLICEDCFNLLSIATDTDINEHYTEYFAGSENVSQLYSLVNFVKDSPIQDLIHMLKYGNKPIVGNYLGNLFAEKYKDELTKRRIDFIIPVPLFHSKKAERGYNQSFHFAKGISNKLGIEVQTSAVKRTRKTITQTHLTREERNENVANAFRVKSKKKIAGKTVLVVDDVITTGSTINECVKILKIAGAAKIYAGSIALA